MIDKILKEIYWFFNLTDANTTMYLSNHWWSIAKREHKLKRIATARFYSDLDSDITRVL